MDQEILKYMMSHDPELYQKFMKNLPPKVLGRTRALQGLEEDHKEHRLEFEKELTELKAKYAELYKPLFDKRKALIAGSEEATVEAMQKGKAFMEKKLIDSDDEEDDIPPEVEIDMKVTEKAKEGIPKFWLSVLENHPLTKEMIEEWDRPILEALTDLRLEEDSASFRLIFEFAENDFFTNEKLIKTYVTEIDNGTYGVKDILGDDIEWKEGKDVTVKKEKKKQKSGKNVKVVTKVKKVESFFRFFDKHVEEDEEDIEDVKLEEFDIGCAIKDTVIPHAVEWYCNELYESDDEEDEEDTDDEEGEEDEEDEPKKKGGKKKGGEQQADCKQQ